MKETHLIKKIREIIKETSSSSAAGFYNVPMRPGLRLWKKKEMGAFTEKLNGYDNAELYVDALDGNIDTKNAKEKERISRKISKYYDKHPTQNDDDGNVLNDVNIKEATYNDGGEYSAPLSFEPIKWDKHTMAPYVYHSTHDHNEKGKLGNIGGKVSFKHGYMEKPHPKKGKSKKIITPKENKDVVNEDLAVWFGKKKKPKGSKQPKGPWVNICKKVDGKHPPCGRPQATDRAYPKCRAAGVAGKMSDSEKRNACQQKRRAEKTHSKSGTGNKPKMVSHKTNENMSKKIKITESQLKNLVYYLNEQNTLPITLSCIEPDNPSSPGIQFKNLKFVNKGTQTLNDKEEVIYVFEKTSLEPYTQESVQQKFTTVKIENPELVKVLEQRGYKNVSNFSFLKTYHLNRKFYCGVFFTKDNDNSDNFAKTNDIVSLKPTK